MKPITSHDPRSDAFDDLIAAALHNELTPEERTRFNARLTNDPAVRAAYQEAQLMHDLLEKTHQNAQPDPAFEQRMVSGVRRKIQQDQHSETAWESALILWRALTSFPKRFRLVEVAVVLAIVAILAGVSLGPITNGISKAKQSAEMQAARVQALADADASSDAKKSTDEFAATQVPASAAQLDLKKAIKDQGIAYTETAQIGKTLSGYEDSSYTGQFAGKDNHLPYTRNGFAPIPRSAATVDGQMQPMTQTPANLSMGSAVAAPEVAMSTPQGGTIRGYGLLPPPTDLPSGSANAGETAKQPAPIAAPVDMDVALASQAKVREDMVSAEKEHSMMQAQLAATPAQLQQPQSVSTAVTSATPTNPAIDTRKLIRDAQLDLEVKSFQTAMDQITALTKSAGGYVDTSNSQKGGNGKLQGTVVVKVLPQNLDSFLFKLRDLGELQNQSVSTDDVTKDYYDTQARLDNSRRMETQLQDLLKRTNGRVSDLLQVERELGRVRGEIEQMQGQLKLYDFQVQYATVTMNMKETDLNQAAAYLLRETDNFSLFATDVEGTFQQMRKAADDFKAHVLTANLNHNSGSDVSATLVVSVPPDQIEPFLAQLRSLGRVANFTRQTERVAKDGGDSDQPADQTLTDKDKVTVNINLRSDDESRKQVAMTVVTSAVDDALDQAKTAALTNAGAEILNSSLNKTPQGQSTAQLSVRVPGKNYHALLEAYRALGRTASFSLQRDDNSGPGANGDDEPVIVSLALTDEEAPLQETEMSVQSANVDQQAQQLKKDAASAGVQVKASSFEREPNGLELAQLTFRLPMSKYPAFVENLQQLGHVDQLTVSRVDRPDQTRTDDSAPAEIQLRLHNQGDIVADNNGLWATLRQTFGEGAGALFGSIRVIGVLIAFLVPWLFSIGLLAWIGRRLYIWKKK